MKQTKYPFWNVYLKAVVILIIVVGTVALAGELFHELIEEYKKTPCEKLCENANLIYDERSDDGCVYLGCFCYDENGEYFGLKDDGSIKEYRVVKNET